MGNIIQASCTCGYSSGKMKQGIGFSFMEAGLFYEPAYCDACHQVTVADGREAAPVCNHCSNAINFYRPQLVSDIRTGGLLEYEDLASDKNRHCPACKKETLMFNTIGTWD